MYSNTLGERGINRKFKLGRISDFYEKDVEQEDEDRTTWW